MIQNVAPNVTQNMTQNTMRVMPPQRAVIYARVSTDAQEDGTSLEAQVAACLKKAIEIGAEPIEIFTEVKSGGFYMGRLKSQEALNCIET